MLRTIPQKRKGQLSGRPRRGTRRPVGRLETQSTRKTAAVMYATPASNALVCTDFCRFVSASFSFAPFLSSCGTAWSQPGGVDTLRSITRATCYCLQPFIQLLFILFLHPSYYPRTTLALPPSSNSDPGSHSGPSWPLPTTARAFIFIVRRTQHFNPSSIHVETCHTTS